MDDNKNVDLRYVWHQAGLQTVPGRLLVQFIDQLDVSPGTMLMTKRTRIILTVISSEFSRIRRKLGTTKMSYLRLSHLIEHIMGNVVIFAKKVAPVVQDVDQLVFQSLRPEQITNKRKQSISVPKVDRTVPQGWDPFFLHQMAIGVVVEQKEKVEAEVFLFNQGLYLELRNIRPVGILL